MNESLRQRQVQTDAIVLGRQDYGEADRILTIFTPRGGKYSVIAKGIRRPKSRFGAHLDLFSNVQLNLTRGRELDIVTAVVPLRRFGALQGNMECYAYASYFAELVRALTQDRQENRRVYDLLANSLEVLGPDIDPWPIVRHFEVALLSALGYQPELFRCVNCGRDLDAEINAYSASLGGMLGPECMRLDPAGTRMSVNAQKYLRTIVRQGLSAVVRLRLSMAERVEVQTATGQHVRFITERDSPSLRVLATMREADQAAGGQPSDR